jgi:hypothetical protein
MPSNLVLPKYWEEKAPEKAFAFSSDHSTKSARVKKGSSLFSVGSEYNRLAWPTDYFAVAAMDRSSASPHEFRDQTEPPRFSISC